MVSGQHIWRFRGIAVSASASALGGVSLWDILDTYRLGRCRDSQVVEIQYDYAHQTVSVMIKCDAENILVDCTNAPPQVTQI